MSGALGAIGAIGSVASLFGKGGSDKGTSTYAIDPEAQARFKDIYNKGLGLYNTPFQPYTGQAIAGFTPDQLFVQNQARGMLGDSFGFDPRQGLNELASQDAPSLLSMDLNAYQNPYTEQVIDNTIGDLDRARKIQLQSDQDAAIGQGAFGGSRSAIIESETNKRFADAVGDISERLRSNSFDRATNLASMDMGRDMQNRSFQANLLGNQLADQYRTLGLLSGIGNQQQALNQAGLDFDYNEFLRGYDDPFRRFSALTGAVSGMPTGSTTTSSNRRGLLGRANDAVNIYDSFDQLNTKLFG